MTSPPTYRKLNPAEAPILILSVSSETLPLTAVSEYADSFLAQQISQVQGVAQVSIGGEQKPSIRVQLDPGKLAARGLTLEEVRDAIVNSTTNAPKGSLTTPKASFAFVANDQITEAEEFEDAIIAYRDGAPVRVRDVGRAVSAASDRNTAAYHYNNVPGILLSVNKQPGANVIATVDQIKAQLPKLTANLPPAITVETVLDRTVTIRASVHEVEFTLVLTVALVVLVVLLFLRNLWATLIPSITVVLALIGSFAAMYLLGFSLNNVSLMALIIAIGFVVDDAIVVVENIYRHMEEGQSPFEAALAGSREIAFTVVSISVSLVAVFIPLLLMGGIVGRLFREFALTVTASILVSAIVSLTLVPMLCSRFMRPNTDQHGRLYRAIESGLRRNPVGISPHARHRAATPSHDSGRVLRNDGADRRSGRSDSEGLLSDTGHRTDRRRGGNLAGGLVRGNAAPDESVGRGRPARSRRCGCQCNDRQHGRQRKCADREYRPLHHRSEAARGTHSDGLADHQPAAAAIGQGPGRKPVHAADPGHHGRRPKFARKLSIYAAKRRRR